MIKKIVTLLLCLSTVSFANTPTRHRIAAQSPDGLPSQSGIQSRVSTIDELATIELPSVVTALVDALPASAKMAALDKSITTDLITAAKRHLGAHYCSGSAGPKAFDCSGFTSFVFKRLGITLNRSSQEQHRQGTAIVDPKDLQPGDLVFFGHGGKGVNHVGIVVDADGDGTFQFIHASTSRGVRIDDSTDDYWSPRFVGGRRIIGTDI